jgi:hypothetical protein
MAVVNDEFDRNSLFKALSNDIQFYILKYIVGKITNEDPVVIQTGFKSKDIYTHTKKEYESKKNSNGTKRVLTYQWFQKQKKELVEKEIILPVQGKNKKGYYTINPSKLNFIVDILQSLQTINIFNAQPEYHYISFFDITIPKESYGDELFFLLIAHLKEAEYDFLEEGFIVKEKKKNVKKQKIELLKLYYKPALNLYLIIVSIERFDDKETILFHIQADIHITQLHEQLKNLSKITEKTDTLKNWSQSICLTHALHVTHQFLNVFEDETADIEVGFSEKKL